ncbi:MAG: hypothetical protein ACT4PO_02155 [Actinomycetota bacterium]
MKKTFVALTVLAITGALGAVGVSAAPAVSHCDGHNDASVTKVEGQGVFDIGGLVVTVDGPTVTFTDGAGNPVDVLFCVKAALGNSGLEFGSSFTVDLPNDGGQIPDISYVVVYGDTGGGGGDT